MSGNKCAETAKYIGENDLLQNVTKIQTLSQYNTFNSKLRKMKVNVPKYNQTTYKLKIVLRNMLKLRHTLE